MSDLSKVLGDLYGSEEPTTTPAARFQPTAPEWADEARLDEAFSGWTPGPPAEAHAMEREMSVVIDAPVLPAARLDEDIAATLNAALVDAGRDNGEPEVPMATAPSYSLPTFDEEPVSYSAPLPPVVESYVPVPEPEVVPLVPSRPWSRTDDDIIPTAARAASAPKVKAPKAPKAPKARKSDAEPKAKRVKAMKVKEPKAPKVKAEKPADEGPKKFLGIELTFKRK